MPLGTFSVVTEDGATWRFSHPLTSNHDHHHHHHFLSTCSVLGTVLDIEWGFKRDKRHSPVSQAACNLIWELKPTQMTRHKNSNKHFSKCKMAWGPQMSGC